MRRIAERILAAVACAILASSAVSAEKIEPAPEYENAFRRDRAWTGGDGTYSYPLANGQILWGFGDTFFGQVIGGVRQEPYQFLHNSMVLQGGSTFTFLPAPVFTPPDQTHWFWLWDAAEGQEILLGEFLGDGQDNGFGFRQVGLWSARFQLSSTDLGVQVSDLKQLPHFSRRDKEQITFGPAILETPQWLYLYGVLDREGVRHSVLARTPRGGLARPEEWRFFDGQQWSEDLWSAQPLFAGGAMEASVHQTASDEYLYIGTDAGGMGDRIIARLSPHPEGPWGEPMDVYRAPEHRDDVFTYNAKAHPELSKDGRLLISYNVNTTDFKRLFSNADIYRPRFFWWTPPDLGWLPARWR
jgi:hypothetical protein